MQCATRAHPLGCLTNPGPRVEFQGRNHVQVSGTNSLSLEQEIKLPVLIKCVILILYQIKSKYPLQIK